MSIPLDRLESEKGNIYEITCAAIRRAYQLTVTGDIDEDGQEKIVPIAIKQILTRKVQYRLEES